MQPESRYRVTLVALSISVLSMRICDFGEFNKVRQSSSHRLRISGVNDSERACRRELSSQAAFNCDKASDVQRAGSRSNPPIFCETSRFMEANSPEMFIP